MKTKKKNLLRQKTPLTQLEKYQLRDEVINNLDRLRSVLHFRGAEVFESLRLQRGAKAAETAEKTWNDTAKPALVTLFSNLL